VVSSAGERGSGSSPERIQVDAGDYRGRPFADARADLREQGFAVDRVTRTGDGGPPGTVASVQPHGMVASGATITLGVWQAPPEDSGGDDTGTAPDDGNGDTDGGSEGESGKGKSDDKGNSDDKGKSEDKGNSDKGNGGLLDLPGGSAEDDGED
jgi:beta-lactam-binding protein with PASTA domain